jgi:hypothetical protein
MWHSVAGYVVPYALEDHSAFSLKIRKMSKTVRLFDRQLDAAGEVITILRNVVRFLPNGMASQPSGLEPSCNVCLLNIELMFRFIVLSSFLHCGPFYRLLLGKMATYSSRQSA